MLATQPEPLINIQFEPEHFKIMKQEEQQQPKYITVRVRNIIFLLNTNFLALLCNFIAFKESARIDNSFV